MIIIFSTEQTNKHRVFRVFLEYEWKLPLVRFVFEHYLVVLLQQDTLVSLKQME